MNSLRHLAFLVLGAAATAAVAAPVTYKVDSRHTYPSFAVDHGGGMSHWRGKFNSSSGTIVLDKAANTGTVDITIDAASIDFGLDDMNKHAKGADMLDGEAVRAVHRRAVGPAQQPPAVRQLVQLTGAAQQAG